jgi:phenylacetate-CoA ligase
MRLGYERKRLADMLRAQRAVRALQERERWSRPALERYKRERLESLSRYAADRSPFWRERLSGALTDRGLKLERLPPLDKRTMMERFDELVTDRRLRREALLSHLEGLDRDDLYLGEFRQMSTSGSSGYKGLFVYDRAGWVGILAQYLRYALMAGLPTRKLAPLRVGAIAGGVPTHMARRIGDTWRGFSRVRLLPISMPLAEIVEALNELQPEHLTAYASVMGLLADEQARGSLRVAPRWISTSSEPQTPEAAARIRAAFGVSPADLYATTEGFWGASCEEGAIHLFEDMTLVENVDEEGRAVPAGEPGARLLVTNLFNRAQPLIRFEIGDVVTIDPEPCRCGRTLVRLRAMEGRADDVLELPGAAGRVAVHPTQFSALTSDAAVREFQVVQEGELLRLRVVLRDGVASEEASARLRGQVVERLRGLGVSAPRVEVERCAELERPASGKLKLVVAVGGRRVS